MQNVSLNRAKKQTKRKLVGKVGELTPGMTKKFTLSNGKYGVEAMFLNYQGSLHAYLNRCPHIGIPLDWVDNQFFTLDGRHPHVRQPRRDFRTSNARAYLRWHRAPEHTPRDRGAEIFVQYLYGDDQD